MDETMRKTLELAQKQLNNYKTVRPHYRIYLQGSGSNEATWCADKINEDDVAYVREDMCMGDVAFTLNNLKAKVGKLESEVAHWRANHDNRVEAARVLIERADLPIERIDAYAKYVEALEESKQASDLYAQLHRLIIAVQNLRAIHGEHSPNLAYLNVMDELRRFEAL